MPVATQQHAEIIEPGDDALEFHAIHQEDSEWNFVFADVIEKSVLKILCAVGCHGRYPVLCTASPCPTVFSWPVTSVFVSAFVPPGTGPNRWPAGLLEGAAGSDASPSSRRTFGFIRPRRSGGRRAAARLPPDPAFHPPLAGRPPAQPAARSGLPT